jgi:NADH:ubiquinone oxidoreductase subunit E
VNGSVDVVRELENLLGVSPGETTPDRIFTVERTSCIGCCDIAPAMRIGEELYGNLTPESIAKTISFYRRKYNADKE